MSRRDILLRAAYDILTRCYRCGYVIEANSTMAFYDMANCSGSCLREDIAIQLDIDDDADPIPLENDKEQV